MIKQLNIVSFDVPYPPNYGGAIDVFYKIKALHSLGVKIHLHTFEYGRGKQEELEKYCETICYYPRNSFISSVISKIPFIVKSRESEALINALNSNNFPILFEGLHTTYPLFLDQLSNRKTFVRAHNIEHKFYKSLAKSETNLRKKSFYKLESKKLKPYESVLEKANGIFSISPLEQNYFEKKYGVKSNYIPAFHQTEIKTSLGNSDSFVLYHGNLVVSENTKAAKFLIEVYKDSPFKLVIASNIENSEIKELTKQHKNIESVLLKESSDLIQLFEKAHINVLPTFQNTGIKLKLLNTLYQGKFVIANNHMVDSTGLESLCIIANTPEEYLEHTERLLKENFNQSEREKRLEVLKKFNTLNSAQKMIDVIFK